MGRVGQAPQSPISHSVSLTSKAIRPTYCRVHGVQRRGGGLIRLNGVQCAQTLPCLILRRFLGKVKCDREQTAHWKANSRRVRSYVSVGCAWVIFSSMYSLTERSVQCYFVPHRCVPEQKVSDDASLRRCSLLY